MTDLKAQSVPAGATHPASASLSTTALHHAWALSSPLLQRPMGFPVALCLMGAPGYQPPGNHGLCCAMLSHLLMLEYAAETRGGRSPETPVAAAARATGAVVGLHVNPLWDACTLWAARWTAVDYSSEGMGVQVPRE